MAARKPPSAYRMSDEHRAKLANSNILNALIEHVEGRREMSSTQVTAGLGLLRKVMPDLTSVSGDEDGAPMRVELIRRIIVRPDDASAA